MAWTSHSIFLFRPYLKKWKESGQFKTIQPKVFSADLPIDVVRLDASVHFDLESFFYHQDIANSTTNPTESNFSQNFRIWSFLAKKQMGLSKNNGSFRIAKSGRFFVECASVDTFEKCLRHHNFKIFWRNFRKWILFQQLELMMKRDTEKLPIYVKNKNNLTHKLLSNHALRFWLKFCLLLWWVNYQKNQKSSSPKVGH